MMPIIPILVRGMVIFNFVETKQGSHRTSVNRSLLLATRNFSNLKFVLDLFSWLNQSWRISCCLWWKKQGFGQEHEFGEHGTDLHGLVISRTTKQLSLYYSCWLNQPNRHYGSYLRNHSFKTPCLYLVSFLQITLVASLWCPCSLTKLWAINVHVLKL